MNTNDVDQFLKQFARRHKLTLDRLAYSQSQTLELALAVAVAEHYTLSGFRVTTINPHPNTFVVKTSTRGHPANFSRFCFTDQGPTFEIHMNLMVRGAHDEGIYCVDLAVTPEGFVPRTTKAPKWLCLPNELLITFAEAKKLVIYPMLIAQFVGIVHEIMPAFLATPPPTAFFEGGHFPPTLVSLGYFSGNSQAIVNAFPSRGLAIQVLDSFDIKLAQMRRGGNPSPFNEVRNRALAATSVALPQAVPA